MFEHISLNVYYRPLDAYATIHMVFCFTLTDVGKSGDMSVSGASASMYMLSTNMSIPANPADDAAPLTFTINYSVMFEEVRHAAATVFYTPNRAA